LALVFVTVHLSLPFTPNICGHSLFRFTYFSAVTQIAHLLAGPGIFTAIFAFEKLAHDLPGRVQRRFSSREISELRPTAVTQLAQQEHGVEAQTAVGTREADVQLADLTRGEVVVGAVELLHVEVGVLGVRAGAAVVQTRLAAVEEVRTQATHGVLGQLRGQVGGDEAEAEGGLRPPQVPEVEPRAEALADAHDLHHGHEEHRQQEHH